MNRRRKTTPYKGRFRFVEGLIVLLITVTVWRVAELQVVDRPFLQNEGDKRSVRHETIPAHRGIIFDRNGKPIAVSTPVVSIWANPEELITAGADVSALATALDVKAKDLRKKLRANAKREFIYLKRQIEPAEAKKIMALKVPGVYSIDEYRRYYPAGSVAAQLVGLTNIDDQGQEGIELAFDDWLSGEPGKWRVLKDRRGHLVREAEVVSSASPGKELMLSIDLRLQYLANKELQKAVQSLKARAASLVMLDVKTGEILAMANQPTFNPNNRSRLNPAGVRNRAITDQIEPGSVIKPLTIAAALESGRYSPHTPIDTSPGKMRIGKDTVSDVRNYGKLDVTGVITKSSNIGVSKIALDLGPDTILSLFQKVGFGQSTGVAFPGESTGLLPYRMKWRPIETATLAYGYGLTVSPLQLAQAYMVLANGGVFQPVTLLKRDIPPEGTRVMSADVAHEVLTMMETVVAKGGTGTRAKLDGYSVAGKTGTVRKLGKEGYTDSRHIGSFVGIAPADAPRIVMVVVIDSPANGKYYGGLVAAPVFSRVAGESLRVLGVAPDESGVKTLADVQKYSRIKG